MLQDKVAWSLMYRPLLTMHCARKDIFERCYKTHLSRRLLAAKTSDDDRERSVIARLKV